MAQTLGQLKAEIVDWMEDSIPDSRMKNAINDAVESLWSSLINFNVSLMIKGPISLSLTAGTEGVILVSVADPTIAPVVTNTAATDVALPSHTVDVAYTFVTESGTETMLSPVMTFITDVGFIAAVHPPAFVNGAFGWNLYARSAATGALVKQNDVPLPFQTTSDSYQNEPDSGFFNDPALPEPPTENTTGDDICYIKHLECQMPDMGWKTYEAADLDSLMMRRAGRSIAASSQYQNYYWDLINQRQLEFRPQLGTDIVPRYFYVKRPRRMNYDNASLPFLSVPSTAFLRDYALSLLFLSVREFESAAAWDAKAERERESCMRVVLDMNRPKTISITPYM